jgi:hypothetical protein
MLRNSVSKRRLTLVSLGVLLALAMILTVTVRPKAALADEGGKRSGNLFVTKECSQFSGLAGTYCTITSSTIPEIQVGSRVFYTQAAVDPVGSEGGFISLDSNVVLYVGTGDWAVGRCTLDLISDGVCTFSDGTGQLTGFHARVDVLPTGGVDYSWNGTYRFSPEPSK